MKFLLWLQWMFLSMGVQGMLCVAAAQEVRPASPPVFANPFEPQATARPPSPAGQAPFPRPEPSPSIIPALSDVKLPAIALKRIGLDPGDDELRRMMKERHNAVVSELEGRFAVYQTGRGQFEPLVRAGGRFLQWGFELHTTHPERVALLEQYIAWLTEVEASAQQFLEQGREDAANVHHVRYLQLDARIKLFRVRRQRPTGTGEP